MPDAPRDVPRDAAPETPEHDWQNLGPRDVSMFVVRLVLWYVLFLIPWTGLDNVYGACFRGTGNAFLRSMGDVTLSYAPFEGDHTGMDTVIELREGKVSATKTINSRFMGYLPTMFLIALVLATRAPWKLRLRRALIGTACISLIVALRVIVDLYATLAPNASFQSISVSDGFRPTLAFLKEIAAVQPSTGFIGAGIVWVVMTILTEPVPEPAE